MDELRNSINDLRASGKLSADRVASILHQLCDVIVPVPEPEAVPEPVPSPEEPAPTEAPVVIPQEDEEDLDQEPEPETEAPQEPGEEPVVKTPKKKRAKSTIVA